MKNKVRLFFLLFTAVFFLREADYIRRASATYDEHFYIAYGSSLLHTWDFRLRKDKPSFVPLLVSAPLLLTKARFPVDDADWLKSDTRELPKTGHWNTSQDKSHVWKFALNFLYKNSVPPDTILLVSRLPVVFLSFLLAFFVFKWTRELYGDIPALIAMGLYTNCPNMLANSGLVTEDAAVSLFIFLTVYFLWEYYKTRSRWHLVLSGTAMGFALNTKYSAVILLPVAACFAVLEEVAAGKKRVLAPLRDAAVAVFTAAAVLSLFYRVVDIREYVMGFRYTADAVKLGQMTFLAGNYSMTGFWNYFLYAFFIKTPLPIILTLGLVLMFGNFSFKHLHKCGAWVYLLLPPAALFLAASFSPLQIGLRHILPIYPFLFVLCGGVYNAFKKEFRWILAVLGVWYLASSARIHPHYLSYFNELAGGPAGGSKYLLDSNLDWGQDLKELKTYVKENEVSDVVLSYFGSSVPEYFGRDFQDLFSFGIWGEKKHINSPDPAKEILAISVTNLQGLYLSQIGFNTFFWLNDKRPKDIIGNTIHIYDITSDTAAHRRLAHIYFISGQFERSVRECERVLKLAPGDSVAEFILALTRFSSKETGVEAFKTLENLARRDDGYDNVLEGLQELINTEYARKVYAERTAYAGIELMKSAKYGRALEVYTAAEKMGQDDAGFFYNKAVALYYLKEYNASRNYLHKALEREPGMSQAGQLMSLLTSAGK
jgi:4-amino-4-deoxy-L-arabinose transferase-like glycosyltransferase